ncbi:hypothetical protein C8R44DRAFT_832240 [Mycena epipterygia]|nr:hypothetical protein C8R44DRAFT_832240 [Mycena epipterygia]
MPTLRGGKPVIYLFSPVVVDAAVRLTLTRDWDLSAIYPVVPQKKSITGGDAVEWKVRVHPDGSLTERTTGLDVAYLFWEALTNHDAPITPPGSPTLGQVEVAQSESFSPTTCNLSPADSDLLTVNSITLYLDKALRALGLTQNYWLPSFLKHTYIALKFGVAEKEVAAGEWSAEAGAGDPARWRDVVGVNIAGAQDVSLFRVLEWGGMEIVGR